MAIYLDNSATSWPKPPQVVEAMTDYINNYGGSPGRSGHGFAIKAAREVFETRELIADLFNLPESERVIFTANATHAINFAFKGLLNKGDHVIISQMEHNSVYRPLKYLENEGIIELSIINCNQNGQIDLTLLKATIKPNTRLVATIHGSNVNGCILPIGQIGEICQSHNLLYLVDAAQTAGLIPIDMKKDNIDILAFAGHKSLYGPAGIGGLCIRNQLLIKTPIHGGSGSRSEIAAHPDFYPDRLEAGTHNMVGIVGLKAGVQYILNNGIETIRQQQLQLTQYLISKLNEIEQIQLISPEMTENRLPVISFNIKGMPPSETAMRLDREFGIMTRAGLQCSPLAHKALGTFSLGTVRLSPGIFTTEKEIDLTTQSLKKICQTHN